VNPLSLVVVLELDIITVHDILNRLPLFHGVTAVKVNNNNNNNNNNKIYIAP